MINTIIQCLVTIHVFFLLGFVRAHEGYCRCQPHQACWPLQSQWDLLNQSIAGNLIKLRPVGHVCHGVDLNSTACDEISQLSKDSVWRANQPGSLHLSNWEASEEGYENCYANKRRTETCRQGRIPIYSAMVETVQEIQESVRFARRHNLRLVVRNTGHDLLGRSSAADSFQIFTNRLKGIRYTKDFRPMNSSNWEIASVGPVVTIGAGVQAMELYSVAAEEGFTVVSGVCSTVGAAGGFLQGGGISILTPLRGLASDNAIEFQMITAEGQVIYANEHVNEDIFWALRGGGGGTFGIVTSVTLKAYPDTPANIFDLEVSVSSQNSVFGDLIHKILTFLPFLTDHGNSAEIAVTNTSTASDSMSLAMKVYFVGTVGSAHMANITGPLIDFLNSANVPHAHSIKSFPRLSSILNTPRFMEVNFGGALVGSQLLSYTFVSSPRGPRRIAEILSQLELDANSSILIWAAGGHVMTMPTASTSVNPAWRSAVLDVELWNNLPMDASWHSVKSAAEKVTKHQMPLLKSLDVAHSGSYLNVGDPHEPDFQEVFWARNYKRLYQIKEKWDKSGLFITRLGVGSEEWDDMGICKRSESRSYKDVRTHDEL